MDKKDRIHRCMGYLKEEGYSPQFDEDGDVFFKYEGLALWLVLSDDKQYFSVAALNIWSIDNQDERRKVEQAALKTTAEYKMVKVFPVRDNTWVVAGAFYQSIEDALGIFPRILLALRETLRAFVAEMNA